MKNKGASCPAFAPPREPRVAPLTGSESWYLQCLVAWIRDRGAPPSVRELAQWVKKSHNSVYDAMLRLLDKKKVRRINPERTYNGNRFVPTEGE